MGTEADRALGARIAALENALTRVLAEAVTDHGDEFPGCRACDAVIEAKKVLGLPIAKANQSWLRKLVRGE